MPNAPSCDGATFPPPPPPPPSGCALSPRSDDVSVRGMSGVSGDRFGHNQASLPSRRLQSAARWRTRGAQTLVTGYDPTRLRSAIPETENDMSGDSYSDDDLGRGRTAGAGGAAAGGAWVRNTMKLKLDNSEDSGIYEGHENERQRSSALLVKLRNECMFTDIASVYYNCNCK